VEFETVERCGRVYVVKNGVESEGFAQQVPGGRWVIMIPQAEYTTSTCAIALDLIAEGMDTWYTAAEAAERLVEIGVFDKVTAHDVCRWARDGLLPSSVKVPKPGQGGSWRIPARALEALAERRGR
jgi:hypothetical protein